MRIAVFLLFAAPVLFFSPILLAEDVIRLSDPVKVTDSYEDFGDELPDSKPMHTLSEAISMADALAGQSVLIETEIQQVCQKKGCFFIARDGQATARVRFKDYDFFIPTDSAGKTVKLSGTLERVELTPAQAEHFAEDLGEDPEAVPMAEFEYQVMATAVRIPKV